jgi:hypothetical protein
MRNKIISIIKYSLYAFLLLVLAEFFLRFTEISLPSFVYDDPQRGRTHKANADIFSILVEGFCMGEVNELGYMGPAYPSEKKPGTLRIALIGDSYVEGIQVFERQHFRGILEKQLSKLLDTKVEVLNFGIGGNDFRGYYLNYTERVLKYNPDFILFFVRRGNFIREDTTPGPKMVIRNDSLVVSYAFQESNQNKLRNKFKFVRGFSIGNLAKESYEKLHRGNYEETLFGKLYQPAEKPDIDELSSKVNMSNDKFYNLNYNILQTLKADSESSTKKIIFVETSKLPDYYGELINKLNLPMIHLVDYLAPYDKNRDLQYWKGSRKFGHWNHRAHEVIGNYLAEKLSVL